MTPGRALVVTFCLFVLGCLAAHPLQARTWSNDANQSWEGEFLRMDGANAVFKVNDKESSYPIARMSAADKLAIFQMRQHAPAAASPALPSASAAPDPTGNPAASTVATPAVGSGKAVTFGGATLTPGQVTPVDLKIPDSWGKAIAKYYGADKPPEDHIKAAMAIPVGFDPDKPQRVLVASATSTGNTLSITVMRNIYTKDALAHGWAVIAADGPDGKPPDKNDNTAFRWDLVTLLMANIDASFPKAKSEWTFATAGFSGGAGYASDQALLLASDNWRVGGMMLLNGGYTPVQWEKNVRGGSGRWHSIPVFISAGEEDKVATPDVMKQSIETTKRGGYQRVRAEWHPGHHEAWDAHVNLALEWFDSLATGSHSP